MSKHLIFILTTEFYTLPQQLQRSVYEEYYRLVYPLIFYILRDHGAVEDIIQESFLKALKKASQLKDPSKLENWLKVMVRNDTLNYLKKFSRRQEELDVVEYLTEGENWHNSSMEPVDQEVETRMMKQAIDRYLHQLRSEYKQIVEMRWYHNLSYKEIAVALDTSEAAVKQRLFRAREAIRQKFLEEWGPR